MVYSSERIQRLISRPDAGRPIPALRAIAGTVVLCRGDSSALDVAEAALDGYADVFAAVRREGLTLGLPVDTAERIFALGFALEQVRHDLRDLEGRVREAARRK